MKKNIYYIILIALVVGCGPKKEEKKSFEYKRTTVEEKADTPKVEKAAVKIENQGIGPIKSMVFDADINKEMADEGALIFKQKFLISTQQAMS